MSITKKSFGTTKAGETVTLFRMENQTGCAAELLDYGCTLHALLVPDRTGSPVDVVLGYDTIGEYQEQDGYLGAAVGRYANRICRGQFVLNGKSYKLAVNDGDNHLHGGARGFDKYIWSHRIAGDSLIFSRTSPDGEEGYPGTLRVEITYTLTADNALDIRYTADSSADTVINLTNHSYFNLDGAGDVLSHTLAISADCYTENDSGCLPTGTVAPVAGTPFDFRTPKPIGRDIRDSASQTAMFGGYDHNFVLLGTGYRSVATLTAGGSGIVMEVLTTKPGVQLYTSNSMSRRTGKNGAAYDRYSAACLETQFFPNGMECPNFPSPILRAGEQYDHRTTYRFRTE